MQENLTVIEDQSVKSSLGWKVEIASDDFLVYSEEDRTIRLDMEESHDAAHPREWTICWPSAWIWNGKKDDPISQKKRYEILDRIELAFWKMDLTLKEIK